ncbi:MAG: hypothetical protein ABT02_18500 [Comamonadaceae bacterium SCN 68-20]|nr:MAG: hypothetical protein ABT02_18500 [Comamonadaceae bacterium SCN 68-20]
MTSPARVTAIGTGLVVVLTSAGLAWRDCLVLAGSAVALARLFPIYMESAAPWDGWRAAISCITKGALIALSGLGLGLWALGVRIGWWTSGQTEATVSLPLLVVAGLVCCAMRRGGRWLEVGLWLAMLGLAASAAYARGHGLPAAPCILALVGAAALMRNGWRLACRTSGDLMRADGAR